MDLFVKYVKFLVITEIQYDFFLLFIIISFHAIKNDCDSL